VSEDATESAPAEPSEPIEPIEPAPTTTNPSRIPVRSTSADVPGALRLAAVAVDDLAAMLRRLANAVERETRRGARTR